MAACPTCNSTVDVAIQQPAPTTIPAVPQAYDLPSALSAIQALSTTHHIMYDRPQQGQGQNGNGTSPQTKKPKVGRYQELKDKRITTKNVKIYSHDSDPKNHGDGSEFILMDRIDGLSFKDTKTNETWDWKR